MKHEMIQQTEVIVMGRVAGKRKEESKATAHERRRSARLATLKGLSQGTDAAQSIDTSSGQAHTEVTMRLETPVPSRLVIGRPLSIPVVAVFSHDTDPAPATDGIWVFASLLSTSSESTVDGDLLQGRRADSVHLLPRRRSGSSGAFAYVSFANLSLSTVGRFRLRLTAIDMKSTQQGRVLPSVTSDVFEVVETADDAAEDENMSAALRHLRNLGLKL